MYLQRGKGECGRFASRARARRGARDSRVEVRSARRESHVSPPVRLEVPDVLGPAVAADVGREGVVVLDASAARDVAHVPDLGVGAGVGTGEVEGLGVIVGEAVGCVNMYSCPSSAEAIEQPGG